MRNYSQYNDANITLSALKKKDLQNQKKLQENFSFEKDFLTNKKL